VLAPAGPTPELEESRQHESFKHDFIERNVGWMIGLIILTVSVGGLVEIVPLFFQKSTTQPVAGLKPYDPVQLHRARHLHPRGLLQLPFADDPSVPRRDRALRPLLGGRRVRLRPPLPVGLQAHRAGSARVGGRYSDEWHRAHLINPRDVVPESNMPAYAWLDRPAKADDIEAKMRALRMVGVPYTDEEIAGRRRRSRARPNWTP
jgi:cytochrome c oxidase cbb3-type subunit 2